jgi:hypothetical protein
MGPTTEVFWSERHRRLLLSPDSVRFEITDMRNWCETIHEKFWDDHLYQCSRNTDHESVGLWSPDTASPPTIEAGPRLKRKTEGDEKDGPDPKRPKSAAGAAPLDAAIVVQQQKQDAASISAMRTAAADVRNHLPEVIANELAHRSAVGRLLDDSLKAALQGEQDKKKEDKKKEDKNDGKPVSDQIKQQMKELRENIFSMFRMMSKPRGISNEMESREFERSAESIPINSRAAFIRLAPDGDTLIWWAPDPMFSTEFEKSSEDRDERDPNFDNSDKTRILTAFLASDEQDRGGATELQEREDRATTTGVLAAISIGRRQRLWSTRTADQFVTELIVNRSLVVLRSDPGVETGTYNLACYNQANGALISSTHLSGYPASTYLDQIGFLTLGHDDAKAGVLCLLRSIAPCPLTKTQASVFDAVKDPVDDDLPPFRLNELHHHWNVTMWMPFPNGTLASPMTGTTTAATVATAATTAATVNLAPALTLAATLTPATDAAATPNATLTPATDAAATFDATPTAATEAATEAAGKAPAPAMLLETAHCTYGSLWTNHLIRRTYLHSHRLSITSGFLGCWQTWTQHVTSGSSLSTSRKWLHG